MSRWDELHQEEHVFLEKEDTLIQETRQVQRIKESYDTHFREAQHFMDDLRYPFHQNSEHHEYESARDEFSHKSGGILEKIEENEQELLNQKREVQHSIEDIIYEKRKATLAEQEETS